MFILNSVEINGLWGNKTIKTKLNPNVNIFIGNNGTGKTTFINIIQAILSVDLALLDSLPFESATLHLKSINSKSNRKITVEKTTEDEKTTFSFIKYKIGKQTFLAPIGDPDDDFRIHRLPSRLRQIIDSLKNTLSDLIEISWLSVHRGVEDNEYYDRPSRVRSRESNNPIDNRLSRLIRNFIKYQLQLQSKSKIHSEEFKKGVLETILYNEHNDTFDKIILAVENIDQDNIENDLIKAYKSLGAIGPNLNHKITNHVNAIKTAKQKLSQKNSFNENDYIPLMLSLKTKNIITLSKENSDKEAKLFKPIHVFLNLLREFIDKKQIDLIHDKTGELLIKQNDHNIPIEKLSSGEKQLLILFIETLLQKEKPYIFFSDEPELSLHISWQRKIIESIHILNPNAQIITATHSPEIVGKWINQTVDMEDIFCA